MRLPFRQLKIAGQTIKVKLDPKLEMWGTWDCDSKVITLGRLAIEDPSQLRQTLKHEMRHAALDLSGVAHGMTARMQEQIVRCFDEIADPAWAEAEQKFYTNETT